MLRGVVRNFFSRFFTPRNPVAEFQQNLVLSKALDALREQLDFERRRADKWEQLYLDILHAPRPKVDMTPIGGRPTVEQLRQKLEAESRERALKAIEARRRSMLEPEPKEETA